MRINNNNKIRAMRYTNVNRIKMEEIILVDAEQVFDKINNPCMVKHGTSKEYKET